MSLSLFLATLVNTVVNNSNALLTAGVAVLEGPGRLLTTGARKIEKLENCLF